MATCSVEGLQDLLGRAGLDTPVPVFPGSDILHNIQDVFKAYLADALQKTVPCDRLAAYDAIQPPNMTGMGDLVIVSPKLRLEGVEPKALKGLVADLAQRVSSSHPLRTPCKASRLWKQADRDDFDLAAQRPTFDGPNT